MKKEIVVKFLDFWESFNPEDNKFVNLLRKHFSVKVLADDIETPDILFYSRCGRHAHLKYDCLKVYYTGENDFPDFNETDYAVSFYPSTCGGRNLRYPLYLLYEPETTVNLSEFDSAGISERGFCSMVVSNVNICDPKRIRIADWIEEYKPISYGGKFRNNIGGPVADKLKFISGYKFNLALENSDVEGYVTEKILEPFISHTVPIYWGTDLVKKDFNPASFINVNDFHTKESLIAEIRRIDRDPVEYNKMLKANNWLDKLRLEYDDRLERFLYEIARDLKRHTVRYGEMGALHYYNGVLKPLEKSRWMMRIAKVLNKL